MCRSSAAITRHLSQAVTGATSTITHALFIQSPTAVCRINKLKYMGLRVYRNGPVATSAVAGRSGLIGVLAFLYSRKLKPGPRTKASKASAVPSQPVKVTGGTPMGKTRSIAVPIKMAARMTSGGGSRTPGPLSSGLWLFSGLCWFNGLHPFSCGCAPAMLWGL